MKKIARMMVFSAGALFITSLWNKGFVVNFTPTAFLKAVIVIALIYYLIIPISKVILLPLNIIFLGLASAVAYFLIFYFIINKSSVIEVKSWLFPGLHIAGLAIQKTNISYLGNIVLSSLSISFIINLLESLL